LGRFFVQIEHEPATNPEIVVPQNNGGSHVALAKTESARVSVQRLPFGLGNSVHGSSRDAHFIVTASVRIRKEAANCGELVSVFIRKTTSKGCGNYARDQILSVGAFVIAKRSRYGREMIAIFACATARPFCQNQN
jgi:hypothetical protein